MIKEWNLLRVIACLSIVFLHSTTHMGRQNGYNLIENYHLWRIMLTVATPTFIVLSEIILSNKYRHSLPDGFFLKRIKFILGPFIFFALIDAYIGNFLSPNGINISEKIYENLLGNYAGYFILIIFQFYILHYLILKFKISVEMLLPVSIIIMVTHLYFLKSDLGSLNQYKAYLKLPFTAWFGYFTVAFLIGAYYEKVAKLLKRFKWTTIILVLFSMYLIYMSFESGITAVNSRRIDIFPLTITVSLAIIAWGQIIPNFRVTNLISNYSLGIYLVHWQVQRLIAPTVADFFNSPHLNIISLFIISLTISMVIIKSFSLLPFGKYIIGNTVRKFDKKGSISRTSKEVITGS